VGVSLASVSGRHLALPDGPLLALTEGSENDALML